MISKEEIIQHLAENGFERGKKVIPGCHQNSKTFHHKKSGIVITVMPTKVRLDLPLPKTIYRQIGWRTFYQTHQPFSSAYYKNITIEEGMLVGLSIAADKQLSHAIYGNG